MFKLDLEKARGTESKLATSIGIIVKAREFQKDIYLCFTDYTKAFVWITTIWKILQEMEIPGHLSCLLEICMQVKKQQLEPDMEKQTDSKLGKEYWRLHIVTLII